MKKVIKKSLKNIKLLQVKIYIIHKTFVLLKITRISKRFSRSIIDF